ncbi:MAG: SGNH/GDSL hydrolase family protein [Candidatus Marinimicrobia bacterium]|nr:SGNH/GDSL hydrolase family protein [Candidatus Neomarinimicrobiota bacterium]
MKKILVIVSWLLMTSLYANDTTLVWVNAETLTRYGQADDEALVGYSRIPDSLGEAIRPELAKLGKHSSGIIIAFETSSPNISVRWKVLFGTHMPHMALTGIQGVDLYAVDVPHKAWNYVGTAKWWDLDTTWHTSVLLENGEKLLRTYALFLPLYDGIDSLFIGVPETYAVSKTELFHPQPLPIIMYGTSITQGGCASRPGMAYPAILSRQLHQEVLNFGFSGNGRLDLEMADYLATLPASLLVIDALPNVDPEESEQKLLDFIYRFRASSSAPILVVPSIRYSHADDNLEIGNAHKKKDEAYLNVQKVCKAEKIEKITFIPLNDICFLDDDGTVDGVHLTDLGMERHADALYPWIKKSVK